ncbi:MAG: ligand-binding sensor domain-containing protein [Bacteroidia bacterium]|jgi:ligand-binding sensor domain-containing protein
MKQILLSLLAIVIFIEADAQITNYTESEGLVKNAVNCLDVAASDVMWFGTDSGVAIFDGMNWVNHNTSTDAGFVSDVVSAITVLDNGDVWIGSDDGAAHFDGSTWTTYTETEGLGDDRIKSIYEMVDGTIAFGTEIGFTLYDGTDWTSYGMGDGLPFGGVTSFTQNSTEVLYFGTALGGVGVLDGPFDFIEEDDDLLNDKVRAVVFNNDGQLLAGTSDGVSGFNGQDEWLFNHTQMYLMPPPDTLNPVEDVKVDGEGNVWAAIYVDYLVTVGGVAVYDGTEWIQYDESNGLVGPVVRQLAIDSENNCWVATSSGVSKIGALDPANTGIFDFDVFDSMSIVPNPASDKIIVSTDDMEPRLLEIYDVSMRLVKTKFIGNSANTNSVDISDLNNGMYVLRFGNSVGRLMVN